MKEIEKFYQALMQEVVALQSGDEDGNTQEQIFTRICLDMLSEAAETENVSVAYDERDLKTKGQSRTTTKPWICSSPFMPTPRRSVRFPRARLIRLQR